MKFFTKALLALCIIYTIGFASVAQDRQYEPIELTAYTLSSLNHVPVNEIFLYKYEAATETWSLIPFQIDERTWGPIPETGRYRWHYFPPAEWADIDSVTQKTHDGIFSQSDELVFLIRDAGDKAPAGGWISDASSQQFNRTEFAITDPLTNKVSYVYAYRSTSISDPIPAPYDLSYDNTLDQFESKYYRLKMNNNGTVEDIAIKEPYGNGQDILDRLKIRFAGIMTLGAFSPRLSVPEQILTIVDDIESTPNPVVRVVRATQMTLDFGELFDLSDSAFPIEAFFYPFSGYLTGGTSLANEDLRESYNLTVVVSHLRESWDMNENAVGMKFYNKYNNGVTIDGVADAGVNSTVDVPIKAWDLTTGDQGSLFKIARFKERGWGNVSLYYYDNLEGGVADSDYFDTDDSGDMKSYGDHGILFTDNSDADSLTLDLDFTAFFIPEKNLDQAYGAKLAENIENPVSISYVSVMNTAVESQSNSPVEFNLAQNYPNPFNGETKIAFTLPATQRVNLTVYDSNGREIKNLLNEKMSAGQHSIHWNGLDAANNIIPSGVYFYSIKTPTDSQTKKLILVR